MKTKAVVVEEKNPRDSQQQKSSAAMDDVLDDMIARANSELMGGGSFDAAAAVEEEDTTEEALAKQFIFCARCFSLRHYGKVVMMVMRRNYSPSPPKILECFNKISKQSTG